MSDTGVMEFQEQINNATERGFERISMNKLESNYEKIISQKRWADADHLSKMIEILRKYLSEFKIFDISRS